MNRKNKKFSFLFSAVMKAELEEWGVCVLCVVGLTQIVLPPFSRFLSLYFFEFSFFVFFRFWLMEENGERRK